MALNRGAIAKLSTMLAAEDVRRIEDNARVAEHVEQLWLIKLDELLSDLTGDVLRHLAETGEIEFPGNLDQALGGFFLQHELATIQAASHTVTPAEYVRAASSEGANKGKWPTDSVRIRQQWDEFRRTGKLPGRARKEASSIKAIYIRRIQQWWQRSGADFIHGAPKTRGQTPAGAIWNRDAFDREGARRAIQAEVAVPRARARTIVETETTRHYNTTRVNTYNQIETVVGYLYVIVRDAGTTKWCRSRAGMVLVKSDAAVLRRNTPPCHWNCRSELLPLSRLNPAHRKLLENMSLRPENRKLEPLPPGWNQAA